MTGNQEWLSTKDASEKLGITIHTLYSLIDKGPENGGLPAYRLGRVIRIRQQDIEPFLEANRVGAGSLEFLHGPKPKAEDNG